MLHIRIAIKRIVEFVLRSGSIDSRFTGTDRALLGAEIHRKIQRREGKKYKAEQSLSIDISEGDIDYTLYGRADGIIREEESIIIDEIKTVSTPVEMIDENYNKAHWAQACFYGYIVCKDEDVDSVTVQLTYYNIDTEEIKRIQKLFTVNELENNVIQVLKGYRKWAELSKIWLDKRTESLKELKFPFENYRQGQRPLAVSVYNTIKNNDRLFACAPTGIGKTMSAVFPSLKAMGENLTDKVFYLTAKTVTSKAATDALSILFENNKDLSLKIINITAKDKMCFLEKRKCDPLSCPYAKDYFDKINGILYDSILHNNVFSRENICKIAHTNTLCPYELSLDISEWCDVIVCDYNYLFDPVAKLQRFFDNKKGEYTFLIDEAHNLPDRAREMYSAVLDKKSFYEIKKNFDKKEKKLIKAFNGINNMFIEYRHMFDNNSETKIVTESRPDKAEKPLRNFVKICSEYFDSHKNEEQDEN
ncbi:MAG: PD-(D/E)XK nuclease family protein, partial [Oscillospiraceae bacterium]|nr:PD-(D/E)XK nuclease family protein [Oscillospiraceae bacterium]